MLRSARSTLELVHRPFLPGFWIAVHFGCGKAIHELIIDRMHRNKLALKVGGQFGDGQAMRSCDTGKLITIVL